MTIKKIVTISEKKNGGRNESNFQFEIIFLNKKI